MYTYSQTNFKAYQFFNHSFNQGMEIWSLSGGLLLVPNVEGQLGYALGVRFTFKLVALLLKERLQFLVIGNDSIVDDSELITRIGAVRVRIGWRGLTVGGPTSVSHAHMRSERLVHVNARLSRNETTQGSNLTDLLEQENLGMILTITINSNT